MEQRETTDPAMRDTDRRRAARRLWRAQAVYIIALAAFAVLAVFAHTEAYFSWDLRAARALQTFPLPGLNGLMSFVSIFGNSWHGFALTIITALLFLYFQKRSKAAALIFSAGGGELLNRIIKIIIARPRPTTDLVTVAQQIKTQSFPSGHVTFYVCYFGFLFFVAYALLPPRTLLRRAAFVITVLPVLLIGLSRVYLGEHWPSDALGAYLFGGLWLALALHLYRYWKRRATFH